MFHFSIVIIYEIKTIQNQYYCYVDIKPMFQQKFPDYLNIQIQQYLIKYAYYLFIYLRIKK